jgi:hypothetical protein
MERSSFNFQNRRICDGKTEGKGVFCKEAIKRLIEFIALILSFREVGSGIFCTTVHWCILQELFPIFWQNEGFPCYPIHHTSPDLALIDFFISKTKNCNQED